MCKRLSCVAIFVFSLFSAQSQLSVSLHEPPSGIVQKSQLWNITLIWSGNTGVNVTIGLSLFDDNENQPIMTAFTNYISLVKGVKQLTASDVQPVEYNYLSSAFDVSKTPDAFLPVGNYRVCYTFYTGERNTAATVLSEDCLNFEVDPLSPPQLNLPADSEIVETPYPQFNWLPPTPGILFNDLNYDLLVTDVQNGQSALEAIQENLPIYSATHLISLVSNYPASNKALDTGKLYAWRIIAKNGNSFSAQSEVWTFSIASKKSEQAVPIIESYLELKNDNSYVNTAIISGKMLGVKFYSYDKTHDGDITFRDSKGIILEQLTRSIQYGTNYYLFELGRSFSADENYSIEIPDIQNSTYKGSFRISK